MDDRARIVIDWLLQNSTRLNLCVLRLSWVKEWPFSLNDFEVSMTLEGTTYIGRGTDEDENIAFLKGAVEAIERYLCKKNKISTNGVALHTSFAQAKLKACYELLERDAFFCYYLTKTQFQEYQSSSFASIQDLLFQKKVELRFYTLPTFNNLSTILATAKGYDESNLGVLIGLGCHEDSEIAKKSSFVEVMRKVAAELDGNLERSYKVETVGDHISHCALWENRNIFGDFKNREGIRLQKVPEIYFEQLDAFDFPLVAMRAYSSQLQNAYWGEIRQDVINSRRLGSFLGSEILYRDLNTRIHPLG